jgi:2-oxoglutarate ferredoxin oxidoreductase subunit alpha
MPEMTKTQDPSNLSARPKKAPQTLEIVDSVTIRFAGDSGDGMQLTGSQFTQTTAIFGNDISTFPDYPAEIRAPAGSLPGVSAFQVHFSRFDIRTPGDRPGALVAMNPAALKVHLDDLEPGGVLIINEDAFNENNLKRAGYETNPLDDKLLNSYQVNIVPITNLTRDALAELDLTTKFRDRCKNFFALGLVYWMFDRELKATSDWLTEKFSKRPDLAEANRKALKAGYFYGETAESFCGTRYNVPKAQLEKGTYRQISGNQAAAMGFVIGAKLANKRLFYGSYPITPASDILHELAKHKNFDTCTFQAEDEIAAVGAAIGASFGGELGITASSGPGIALKAEAINLAVMVELPLVVIDVQRGGPSTGLPTKAEQADLLQVLFGRNSESPVVVLAPATPAECFEYALEALRLATKYMTPVFFMSDADLANGAQPWKIPAVDSLPTFTVDHPKDPAGFQPYSRDEKTLARPWVVPGTPGLEHRLGGLEKQNVTGTVSYDPLNHQHMCELRAAKIAGIASDIPAAEVFGENSGKVLVVGWGSTFGAITTAVEALQKDGKSVSAMHLRYLNPMPENVGDVLGNFEHILVPELNLGQLRLLLRDRFLIDAKGLNKVQGKPFQVEEVRRAIEELL